MTTGGPRPGGEIDAWCTKCRMDLLHRIIAVHEGQIARVECRTCGGHHNYRRQRTAPAKAAPSTKPRSPFTGHGARAAAAAEVERQRVATWIRAVAGKPDPSFKPYRATETYVRGDLVRHGKFGDGYVVKVIDRQKVEAMFKDGPRTLAHALDG